ncbi:MAG: NAD(P)/FAD-dependent oxidoreductase [Solirubrobacterales bacterium]|nr:NAD(P)/FAD-dependent oxidoreductase [Solirubrobacterales bacterium]
MPVRATKRGDERTPLSGAYDVLICGASFAGLTIARELQGSGKRVLLLDRYEIGERQTSACAAPTEWLVNLGLEASIVQSFAHLVMHRPAKTYRWKLPFTFSTFDYRHLCALLREQGDETEFETAKIEGRTGFTVHTDRGDVSAPLIVDAMGWRRTLSNAPDAIQPPNARLSRGLEVHPPATGEDLELWLDKKYVPRGYGWAFPAGDEVRIGLGSFDPRKHVKKETVELTRDLGLEPNEYQGNWIPHELRDATEDGIFFVGDSAGHCLPLSAEGIRTAFYFGLCAGREIRMALEGRQSREQALERYDAFSEETRWKFRWMLRTQTWVGRCNHLPLLDTVLDAMSSQKLIEWSFTHYFKIADPAYALEGSRPAPTHELTPA